MKPEAWERLQDLLQQILAIPVAERQAFVEKIRLENEELGQELGRIIRAQDDTVDAPPVSFRKQSSVERRFFEDNELILDRFRIVRFVGGGGMGEVYEAADLHLGRVALKTIRPALAANPRHLARFSQEVQLARKVTNVHVCRIHELFMIPANERRPAGSFLTMEFLDGTTLAHRIETAGPLPIAEAESITLQLCSGLQAIHDAGIIHRDIKSHNVMLTPGERHRAGAAPAESGKLARPAATGGVHPPRVVARVSEEEAGTHAVVMDLGLARVAEPSDPGEAALTTPGAVMGTPQYMAPEQFQAQPVTPATDIYALGVVLYEMLTGNRPFQAPTPLGAAILRAKPPCAASSVRPEIPFYWDRIISRCLEYEPAERFQSAQEVAQALKHADAGPVTPAPPPPFRKPLLLAWIAVAAAIVLAVAGWLYWRRIAGLNSPEQRVAVLAFENIGGDAANQAFCDGLMETLASQLTDLERFQPSLSVVPASDVRREKIASARDAQRAFGVNLVVTGSVQRSPNGIHLIANVVDARQLKQLGSREVFVSESDMLSMQQGVITQIADLLRIQLHAEAQQRLKENDTPVPGAYDFYLQGRGYLLAGRVSSDQAIAEFQHALDRDPNYALAHAGLGEAYWNKYLATNDRQWIDEAWRECRRAIELGPHLAAAHVTLARLNSGTGQYEEAIRQAEEAIRVDPADDSGYSQLARALEATNRLAAAEATLGKAIRLRPSYWINYANLGILYQNEGKYQQAIAPFTRITELVPDNPAGYTDLGSIYHLQGREQEAEQMFKKSIQVRPTIPAYSDLATAYFFQQRYADAVAIYEKLTSEGSKLYLIWGNLGDAYRWAPGLAAKAGPAYTRAIQLAEQAVGVNPRDALAWISLGLYHAKLGQKAEALRDMDTSLSYASNDKNILFNATIVCELTGDRARAIEYLRRAASGGYSLSEIAKEPELGKLREDPAYKAALPQNH